MLDVNPRAGERAIRVAQGAREWYVHANDGFDWNVLHEEIDRLPERLRATVALCYLEGLTYAAAAQRLLISEGVVRGRLSLARKRLRTRLTRRGLTIPTGLLVAGATGSAQATLPPALILATIRIALGWVAADSAVILARGAMKSLLFHQIRVAAGLLLLGIGGHYFVWTAFAALQDIQGKATQPAAQKAATTTETLHKAKAVPPQTPYRLSGTVKVEKTDDPIAGAKLLIQTGDLFDENRIERLIETGADGRFAAELPAGGFQIRLAEAPVGYCWVVGEPGATPVQSSSVGPDRPAIELNFQVREGTIWDFRFTRGPERKPCPGFISGDSSTVWESFEASADDAGAMHLTLPTDEREVALMVQETSWRPAQLDTGFFYVRLKWDSGFRPDQVRRIEPSKQMPRGLQLIDADENSAFISAPSPQVETVVENGRLVVRVTMPDRGSQDFGAVTGQVLDDKNQPIPGVRVGLAAKGQRVSNELRHQSTTNAQGQYRLRDIPRRGIDGAPVPFQIIAVKEAYASQITHPLTLKAATAEKLEAVEPIRLQTGVEVKSVVVDHRGQPVAGARVFSEKPLTYRGLSATTQTAWSDTNGRFTLNDLRRGMTTLFANGSRDGTTGTYERLSVGSGQSVVLQLPEPPRRARLPADARTRPPGQDRLP